MPARAQLAIVGARCSPNRRSRWTRRAASGERCRWHLTAADTAGRLVRAEVWVPPGAAGPPQHAHPLGEERIELLGGTMALTVNGRRETLRSGDRAAVPAGAAHRWRNAGADVLHFVFDLDAAPRFEEIVAAGLLCPRRGFVQRMLAARPFDDELRLTGSPRWLQRALFATVARFPGSQIG